MESSPIKHSQPLYKKMYLVSKSKLQFKTRSRCILPMICVIFALCGIAGYMLWDSELCRGIRHQTHYHKHEHYSHNQNDDKNHRLYEISQPEWALNGTSRLMSADQNKVVIVVEEEFIFTDVKPLTFNPVAGEKTCLFPKSDRRECYSAGSKFLCRFRGCCWSPSDTGPLCFYSADKDNSTYMVRNLTETHFGYSAMLTRSKNSIWHEDVVNLQWDIMYETKERLHFKIYDPDSHRYEVPIETPKMSGVKASDPMYNISFSNSTFGFSVTRTTNSSSVLFGTGDTKLVFADQYIEISTTLPTKYVYGFGEHRGRLMRDIEKGFSLSLWARDQKPCVGEACNLYGVHPMFISLEESGEAYGVFLLNSNAMEIFVTPGDPPVLTYRTIGGILDFYIFTGPTPENVVNQYLQVIGKPYMPPYWALGYHLCRYGYKNATRLKGIINRMRNDGFPYDTQWTDIDYMDKFYDWTYDKANFSDLPAIVGNLHDHGQHYIIIVDPGIKNRTGYPVYDEGLKNGVFITKSGTKDPLIGYVWPGQTAYPDFFNPDTQKWWLEQAKKFHNGIKFDGLWTDMNEPSNFIPGSVDGCTDNKYDNPPYTPVITGGNLAQRTICPSAEHKSGLHYNLHSLYGLSELTATISALHELRPGKRSIVISRSTFPSSGRHAGHWTGDTVSTWDDLRYSIAAVLRFQFFGIPFTGADICGFSGVTNGELCVRWTQLGAFYPFMRNHASLLSPDQDPGADMFNIDQKAAMLSALRLRYTLLPYLYSLLHKAHIEGATVARPLWFEYTNDINTYTIDNQLMWGDNLLITPVVQQGKTSVNAYFPADTWVDILSGEVIKSNGSRVMVDAPLDKIPVYQRAGSIIPVNTNRVVTTTAQRKTPFTLWIALDDSSLATGSMYWDDGETLGATETGSYNYIYFRVKNKGLLTSTVIHKGFQAENMTLEKIVISNVEKPIIIAAVNGLQAKVDRQGINQRYSISGFTAKLLSTLTVQWN